MIIRIINALYRKFVLPPLKKKHIREEQMIEERQILELTTQSIISPLNESEQKSVEKLWHPAVGGGNTLSFRELAIFKHFNGFDSRYVSHFFYLPILSHKLNNYKYTLMFEHKSFLGAISKGTARFPSCFVRCIDGELYDNEMQQLSLDQSIQICQSKDIIIVKDSVASSGGKSVEKILLAGKSLDERRKVIEEIITHRKGHDFVIQECIKQHPSLSALNETSINTFRVTSLYLNGKFSILSVVLRIGKKGSSIDNWAGGGILVGVDQSGHLFEKGYDNKFNSYNSCNGKTFNRIILPQVPAMLKLLEEAHKTQFSICKLIGWDVAIDDNNEPIIIELNSSQPGLIGEQLATGPIFGDRTEEVIKYCSEKKFSYNRSIFSY